MTSTYVPDDIDVRRKALELLNAALAADKTHEDNDPDQSGIADDELAAKAWAAWAAYEEAEGPAIMQIGLEDIPAVCAVSGVPVWVGDEVLHDSHTDEVVLRAAIGLPPRPDSDDESEDDDVEEAA